MRFMQLKPQQLMTRIRENVNDVNMNIESTGR